MKNFHQFVLIASTLLASWLGMQMTHEFGHVVGAWLTGGEVSRVVLHPLTISQTDLKENPRPLAVVWAGPTLGVVIPLVFLATAQVIRVPFAFILRFFAGFCLVANGLYIGLGSFACVGDCGDMLRYGSEKWQMCLFGLATIPVGLWLWHGQGSHFGLRAANAEVNRGVALGTFLVFCGMLLLGIIVGQ